MPTLEELFKTYDNATATVAVNVDGVQLGRVDAVDYGFAIGLVPTATIRISGDLPAGVLFRSRVTIDEGFNGVTQRRFTGRVYHINPDEQGYTLECMGQSWVLDVPYHDVVLTIDNITVSAAVTQLLQDAGATLYSVDVPARTMGTVALSSDPDRAKVVLEFQTYGEAIVKVAEPDGSRWMEMPDGAIRVRQADPIPSLTAAHQIFAMQLGDGYAETYPDDVTQTLNGRATRPRIRSIRAEKQIREVKNRCVVKGATYEQVNADGTVDAIDVDATAQAPSPWVRNEDGTQAYNTEFYSNEVLDTAAWAGEVAGRIVGVKNRLNDRLIVVMDGCPLVQLGMTLFISDPQYSGVVGRYFVEEYSTSISAGTGGDYVTTVTCVGGSEAGGTVNVSPFAVFSHTVEREVIGDRVWAVVTLDARQSSDPDGSIASYAWSGDVTGSGAILYKRVDPTVVGDSISVTLTVTDDLGATDAITLEITITAGTGGAFIPALFVAGDTHFSASPDGGINWNDQAVGGGDSVISVGARPNDGSPGIAVYGTNLGAVYRTTDFCATAPTLVMAAVGSPIVHLGRSYAQDHNVMWALAQDGRLYRSNDSGATWFLWDDLRVKFSKPNLRASKIATPSPDGVWVFGGDGEGRPFIAYDPVKSHAWGQPLFGGEIAADINFAAPSDPTLYIADYASVGQGDLAILLNSALETNALYFTNAILGDGSAWRRAAGAPAKSRGQWMTAEAGIDSYGHFQFGYDDTVVYLADESGGVLTVSVAAAALDAGDEGNNGLAIGNVVGGVGGAHILAAEGTADGTLYKTWDRFASIGKLRPATGFDAPPAGWNAKAIDISIGVLGTGFDERLVAVGTDASPREFTKLLGLGEAWTAPTSITGITATRPTIRAIDESLMFSWSLDSSGNPDQTGEGNAARSTDGGATWAAMTDPGISGGGICDIRRDGNGRLWVLFQNNSGANHVGKISYSDDDGVTWVAAYTISVGGSDVEPWQIMPHPTNPNILAVVGIIGFLNTGFIAYTTNAQVAVPTFTRNNNAALRYGSNTREYWHAMLLPNNRIVVTRFEGTAQTVYYTDDWGVTVTTAATFTAATADHSVLGFHRNTGGDIVSFLLHDDGDSSGTESVRLYRSTDGGKTYSVVALAEEYVDFITGSLGDFGFASDPDGDACYLRSDATQKVAKLSPVSSAGVWTDLTGAYPHAAATWANLDFIPRL